MMRSQNIAHQDKISNGCDAFLHWMISAPCNLNCHYCFSSKKLRSSETINFEEIEHFFGTTKQKYLVALSSDGEPFLHPDFIKLCKIVIQNHLIILHSNLTLKKESLLNFINEIPSSKVGELVASFHIEELHKTSLVSRFEENLSTLKEHGFKVRVVIIAHPKNKAEINLYNNHFKNSGYEVTIMPFIGIYKQKKYPQAYSKFEIADLKLAEDKLAACNSKNKICNAGYNIGFIHNSTIISCTDVCQPLGNFKSGINWRKSLTRCPSKRCSCPYYFYFTNLLSKGKHTVPSKPFSLTALFWKLKYRLHIALRHLQAKFK